MFIPAFSILNILLPWAASLLLSSRWTMLFHMEEQSDAQVALYLPSDLLLMNCRWCSWMKLGVHLLSWCQSWLLQSLSHSAFINVFLPCANAGACLIMSHLSRAGGNRGKACGCQTGQLSEPTCFPVASTSTCPREGLGLGLGPGTPSRGEVLWSALHTPGGINHPGAVPLLL